MLKSNFAFIFFFSFTLMMSCGHKHDEAHEHGGHEHARHDEDSENPLEFYQLKTYTFNNLSQVATTDEYLEKAYLPALKRMGIKNIGVFKDRPVSDSLFKTYVLIPYQSLSQFERTEEEILEDEAYQSAGSNYINAAYNNPPYTRMEITIMRAFADMPQMKPSPLEGPRADRIYELRSYESATEKIFKNKVHMFNEGGEVKLFDRLGFNAVFYSEVIAGKDMPNLIYMTTHANREVRDANWKNFVDAPEWKALIADETYKNNVSKNTQMLLYPTPYSDY